LQFVAGPLLSIVHVCCVIEEMRATPVNTLNPQRTAMVVADFVKVCFTLQHDLLFYFHLPNFVNCHPTQTGKISSPADLRYHEDLLFPGRLIENAGNVKVGQALHRAVRPSKLRELKEIFPGEKFILSPGNKWTDLVLEQNASGEDALRAWLVAAYASSMKKSSHESTSVTLQDAYEKMNSVFDPFLSELQAKGWHTDRFLDGTGSRFSW
jgi:hypothetical protein